MFFLDFIARLFNALRSAATPHQIAAAVVIGMFGGLSPSLPIRLFVSLILIVFNVNAAFGFLSVAFFGAIAFIFDPLLHQIGYGVLAQVPLLRPVWTELFNVPFIPFTRFNNTVVMGGLAMALLLSAPVYIGSRRGVTVYRLRYHDLIANSRILRTVTGTRVYLLYSRIKQLGDKLW